MPETVAEFGQMNLEHLRFVVQRESDALTAMLLPEGNFLSVQYVAQSNFQICPECTAQTPDLVLRHWRFVWSIDCEKCGKELVPTRSDETEMDIVSAKLVMRAKRGAEVLKTTFDGKPQVARRLSRVFHMMCAVGLTDSTSLISSNKAVRFSALVAIGICMSPAMLTLTPDSRRVVTAARHLSRLFPRYREAITKIAEVSEDPAQNQPRHSVGEVLRRRQAREKPETIAPSWALVAAKQAIGELGSDADRHKLLARADAISSAKKNSPAFKSHQSRACGYLTIKDTKST